MKKKWYGLTILLCAAFFLLSMPRVEGKVGFNGSDHWPIAQEFADSLVIGDGTEQVSNTPVYPYYGYSFTQTLYLQQELNFSDMLISQIGYQYSGAGVSLEIEVWMGHTGISALESTIPLDGFTKVYDGPWDLTAGDGFSTIEINPFPYNNSDNLVVTVIEKLPGWNSPSDAFLGTLVTDGQQLSVGEMNDGSPYDPENLPAGSPISYRPNTQFWLMEVPEGPAVSSITPLMLNFGDVEVGLPKTMNLTIKNLGVDPLVVTGFESSNSLFTVVNTTFPLQLGFVESAVVSVQFTPDSDSNQAGTITFLMDAGIEGDRQVEMTGRGVNMVPVIIGEGEVTSGLVPVSPYFGYSFSQTLYLQEEINIEDKMIQRIGYHYTGASPSLNLIVEIYLSHTDSVHLENVHSLANHTKVYDGPIIFTNEGDFNWVETDGFYYNNTQNLIVTVIEKKPGWDSPSDEFYVTELAEGSPVMSRYARNDSSPYDPSALPSGSSVSYRPNIKLWMGDVPTDPVVTLTPEALDFGQVENTVAKVMTVRAKNTGGGILSITGIDFSNDRFSVINGDFPVELSIGETFDFEFQFIPQEAQLEEGVATFLMDESIPGNKTVQLTGRGLRFGVLREGFENELFPPLGWKVVDANGDNKGWYRNVTTAPTGQTVPRTGIAAAGVDTYAGSPGQLSYDDWLITPEMIWQDGDLFSFWIKRLANQTGQTWKIGYSTEGSDPADFTIIDEITDPLMTYTEKSYDMSQYGLPNGEAYYMAIQFTGQWSWPGVIDDVLGSVLNRFEKDLMITSVQAEEKYIYVDEPTTISVTYANYGLMPVEAGDYQVQVCTYIGGTEVVFSQMDGQALAIGEVVTLDIDVVLTQIGKYGLYVKLQYPGDMDLPNNNSEVFDVEVIPASMVVKQIGEFPITGSTSYTSNFPIDFEESRGSSLSQMLYFAPELNVGGMIDRISFYRNFATPMVQRKVMIWMSSYAGSTLETYVPPAEQQLVFDGRIDFTDGMDWTDIKLNNPFIFAGDGHLLVTIYYYDGNTTSSQAKFAVNYPDYGPNRTIYEYGWGSINPANPTHVSATNSFPHTLLLFETGNGLGAITGRVLFQEDNNPVDGAEIKIHNPLIPEASAYLKTDANGYFAANQALAGEGIQITISKYGYSDVVLNDQVLLAGGTLNIGDVFLTPRPQINLDGSVLLSDSELPAVNALVKLSGMDQYETVTGEDGSFHFENIWGTTNYFLEITLAGYQKYVAQISVPATDYELSPITILEQAPAPNLVNATEVDGNAVVSWFAAGQPYPYTFRYDDGKVDGVLITPGEPNIVGGTSWKHHASLKTVQWYTYNSTNFTPSDEIRITILGLRPDGSPNPNDVLYVQDNIPNEYGWNSITLTGAVETPNGFFLGISGYNNYTLIAYDDGVGEPWEWASQTQWSNGLGAYYPLENATSPPLRGNIFIRAGGLTYGPVDQEEKQIAYLVNQESGETIHLTEEVVPLITEAPQMEMPYIEKSSPKEFESYNVYRRPLGDMGWDLLNTIPVADTSFVDNTFNNLPYGVYQYGVEAVYTNNVVSEMALSNDLEKDMRLDVIITVNNNAEMPVLSEGARVRLTNQSGNVNHIYTGFADEGGTVLIPEVLKGVYDLYVTHVGFHPYAESGINLEIEGTAWDMEVEITERIDDPYDVEILTEGQSVGTARLLWNQPPVLDDVESYEAFIISDIGEWKMVDQDGQPTLFLAGVSYPNASTPKSFMIMNPTLTTPPLDPAYWNAYSGNQYFAAFGSDGGLTNNWLISPPQNHSVDYTVSFYAKSFSDTYGLETFRIGYSTDTDNTSDFVFITGNETALTYWTRYSYSIPKEAKYFAIRHNHTGSVFMVDDISIGVVTDGAIPGNGFSIYLDDELVAEEVFDVSYEFNNLTPGSHTAGVKAVYHTGESQLIALDFELPEGTPVNFEVKDHNGQVVDGALVEIISGGTVIFTGETENGNISTDLYPGNYQYIVSKDNYSTAQGSFVVSATSVTVEVELLYNYNLVFTVKTPENQLLHGATVVVNGTALVTNESGFASFVVHPGTFPYAVTFHEYETVLSEVTVSGDASEEVIMAELTCEPPQNLDYSQEMNNVTLEWEAPELGANGTWLHWDGEHNNSIGTGGPVDFDVAQRFVPSDLEGHDGKFLTRVLFVPREANSTYSIRVWTGGNISAPENLVVDQVVTNPVINAWNEVFLTTPVLIDSSKELWIGFRSNTQTGYPAGTDAGPAIDGKGNMINLANTGWQTLLQVGSTLNYNWSVRGLIEAVDVPYAQVLSSLEEDDRGVMSGALEVNKETLRLEPNEPRILLGYNVFRNGQLVNDEVVPEPSYEDNELDLGTYEYYVTSVWNSGCESEASNVVSIEVDEISCPAPFNLEVWRDEEDSNLVRMIWNEEEPQETEFRYDDGVRTGQLGFQSGTINGVLGAAHPVAASLSQMSWLLSDATDGGGPHETIQIYVFGLTETGTPASEDLLYTAEVSNIDGEWNTYEFPETIQAPGGFFVGVAYSGFAGLGTDDGLGDPYVYSPNTHFYTSDYTSGNWTPWEESGFSVNGLIRAMGMAGAKISTLVVDHENYNAEPSFVYFSSDASAIESAPAWNNRDSNFLGYNIYHQGVLLETQWQETSYSYQEAEAGLHCYSVSAVYENCGESEMSNEACVEISVGVDQNLASEKVRAYPNPADELLFIEGKAISRIILINSGGRIVLDISGENADRMEINVGSYPAGLYLLVVNTAYGSETLKMMIK